MADKSDLKLFGEIEKRVAQLDPNAKDILKTTLRCATPPASVRIIEQTAERYAALSEEGRAYVDRTLGIERAAM